METIAQRFDRLAGAFAAHIDAVPEDRWDAPSPCEGWTALDVVRHVSETPGMFFQMIGAEFTPPPPVEDGPGDAFGATRARVQAALDDPAVAGTEFDGFMGRSTFEAAVDRFLNFDLVVHGWDLARAAGIEDTIAEPDLERLEAASTQFGDALRAPGVFGPEVEPPPGASRQDRLMAFLGRRV